MASRESLRSRSRADVGVSEGAVQEGASINTAGMGAPGRLRVTAAALSATAPWAPGGTLPLPGPLGLRV